MTLEEFDDICIDIRNDIRKGNSDLLREFFLNHKELINVLFEKEVLTVAARYNNVDAIKMFLDAGFSPDARTKRSPKLTALSEAISGNAIDVIRLLLDAGADIHDTNFGTSASYITSAVISNNFPLVKLFCESGVDVNAEYILSGKRFNALKWTVLNGNHEIAAYLKSKGAKWIEEIPGEPKTPEESILQFLSEKFKVKPLPLGVTEIVPASVPLSVHTFPPAKRGRKTTIFATLGLCDYALVVTDEQMKYEFAEYILEIPYEKKKSQKLPLHDDENAWAINCLKAVGRYPHENETSYGAKAKIAVSQIPDLELPDNEYKYVKITYDPELDFIVPQDGRSLVFYRVVLVREA
jgi:hypothetical protein